ncbi:DUF4381 domain-containing protein [Roseibium polysiphoniae]|uniref:DUF4381 domain-containing protein n=1 Tax=Roseibium polysiphoniae TaxID=2571221 RepID=A0A944CH58_9HYPH|nr:DUF4381 domain-containing protein [Roseibium polysiphoniae]MBS8261813.1 DUF4381 domain-containing protein [Roseibium polysiphoniae]
MKDEWKGLNLAELVDLLQPMPEPSPVSMVPQTAGWLWLAAALAAFLAFAIWQVIKHRKKTAYRRQALEELTSCSNDPQQLAELLRRTALSAYSRSKVASLHGQEWLSFLDRTYGGTAFSDGPGKAIATAPYQDTSTSSELKSLVQTWIRTHKGDAA